MPVTATDSFSTYTNGPGGPYSSAVVVSPSDSDDLALTCNAIYVGVAGDVKVDMAGTGTAIVFKAMPVGIHRIRAKRVYSTGTTATDMKALY